MYWWGIKGFDEPRYTDPVNFYKNPWHMIIGKITQVPDNQTND